MKAEKRVGASGTISEAQRNWLEWARQKADWYDPFTEREDALLCAVDKETFMIK